MSIRVALFASLLAFAGCKKKSDSSEPGKGTAHTEAKSDVTPTPTPTPSPPPTEGSGSAAVEKAGSADTPGPSTPSTAGAPAGNPPPDGKYERVTIDGVTVPMINVMNGGTVVLVDTDGKKPRSWEEQYKKKSAPLAGQFDIHKTNTNKNDTFEDDEIDKQGIWVIDVKGNITKH
ncbi:MAG TPA: hypothetical protein VFQ53_07250 [Kofleriaceae bacterium]|nr:hypothetical protein [Kofleriaceae bacterium]